MKITITTILALAFALFPPMAMSADVHHDHVIDSSAQNTSPNQASMSEGIVKKVDKASGKATISHGPLVNLNMPPMTMAFRVKEATWLNQMQIDSKVRFIAESVDGTLTIVRFEPVK